MRFIRQNATHKVVLGPFVDVGDGFTPETGVALSSADEAEVILHDGTSVVDISGYTWAAITTMHGYYNLTLQSGISGTVGHMIVVVQDDSVCLPVKAEFTVVEEAVYDAFYAASATGVPALAALEASIATAQADLDIITGASGVNLLTATQNSIDAIETDTGTTLDAAIAVIDANVDQIETAVITNASGADIAADIIALKAETVLIVADTNELQGDWTNTGRLDTILDSILTDTGTTIPGTITTIDGNVDAILLDTAELGAAVGASISADIAAIKAETALIVADTNELQGDWTNTGRLDTILDSILTDTGTTIPGTITTIDGNVDAILLDTAEIGAAGAGLTAITGAKLASDGVDLVLVDGKTLPASLQIIASANAGKISGAGTGTETFLGIDGSTTRVTVTVDSSGNRTAVTYA